MDVWDLMGLWWYSYLPWSILLSNLEVPVQSSPGPPLRIQYPVPSYYAIAKTYLQNQKEREGSISSPWLGIGFEARAILRNDPSG